MKETNLEGGLSQNYREDYAGPLGPFSYALRVVGVQE